MLSENTGISIIIPTHGREALIQELCASLVMARAETSRKSEVLVIDSSPDIQANMIQRVCDEFDVKYLRYSENNVRKKRNCGIENAQYPLLLFIDSDCRATTGLLEAHAMSYTDSSVGGIAGLTRFVGRDSWIWNIIKETSMLDSFVFAKYHQYVPWGPTCNMSYLKEAVEKVGGFETDFPFRLGGDDVDLGLRVSSSGYKIKTNPEAIVEHSRETWEKFQLIWRRNFRWGRMRYYLIKRHKERTFLDLPKIPGLFIILLAAAIISSIVLSKPYILLLPILWGFLTILLESLMIPKTFIGRFNYWFERGFSVSFEFGTILESLIHLDLRPFFTEISSSPPNMSRKNVRMLQIWAALLSMILVLFSAYGFI